MHAAEKIIANHLLQLLAATEEKNTHFQQLADQYPYFGAAHYLYAKELKNGSKENADKEVKKTVLFFNNPFWLQYLLHHDIYGPFVTNDIHIDTTEEEEIEETFTGYPHSEEEKKGNEKISGILKEHAALFAKPVSEKAAFVFENIPRHTIDYFESLGIKLDVVQQGDQLGNKVKKFTDWLKQMKKNGNSPADLGTDKETEQLIEVLAENSNATKEVITEAMAEVLIKQGKKSKAIELYEKLSFLNPAKSTYFAAKIQSLKN